MIETLHPGFYTLISTLDILNTLLNLNSTLKL